MNFFKRAMKNIIPKENQSKYTDKISNFANYLEKGSPEEAQQSKKMWDDIFKEDPEYKKKYDNMVRVENQFDRDKKDNDRALKIQQRKEQIEQEQNSQNNEFYKQEYVHSNGNHEEQGIPFMITKSMKLDLLQLGFTHDQIKNLTPTQAQMILQNQKK